MDQLEDVGLLGVLARGLDDDLHCPAVGQQANPTRIALGQPDVIAETQALTGREIEWVYVDKGYRGHGVAKPLGVYISGQKRGVVGAIKRELRRRSAVEAVIGHMKADGHLDRNFLKGRDGDHANAMLTAVGYNLRLVLNWLKTLLRQLLAAFRTILTPEIGLNPSS